MADLAAAGPLDGLGLPLAIGGASLSAVAPVPRTAIAPLAGREPAVAAALGHALPPPGAAAARPGGRILWAGAGLWLLEGPPPVLADHAAVADHTDAWAALCLGVPDARAVLARLAPLDLDPAAFPPGTVARTLLRHLPLILVASAGSFELLVPRSYARSAVKDIATAMSRVAGRAALARP